MLSVHPSILVLGLAAFAALFLALNRCSLPENQAERLAAARVLVLTVTIQSVHRAEVAATGFHDRLGSLVGLLTSLNCGSMNPQSSLQGARGPGEVAAPFH